MSLGDMSNLPTNPRLKQRSCGPYCRGLGAQVTGWGVWLVVAAALCARPALSRAEDAGGTGKGTAQGSGEKASAAPGKPGGAGGPGKPPGAPPPAPVIAAPVALKSLAAGQSFVGTVLPMKRSAVGSAVDGRVTEFPINEGDRVAKGNALCRLLTETISLQIQAAEAELQLRQSELEELRNGSRVEEIASSEAKVAAARALMDYTASKLKRTSQLAASGQITQEQLEETRSAADSAAQEYTSARELLAMTRKGPREERISQAIARVGGQAALVDQLKDQLKKHTMIAPFDGYVVAEKTEVGEWVSKGQTVAELVFLDEVEVEAHVNEDIIDQLQVGMAARVEIPSLKTHVFVGTVSRISPQADLKARTFPVKIRVVNTIRETGPLIKAGMLARVWLPTGQTVDSLLVPKDAVILGGAAPAVYLFQPDAAQAGAANLGAGAAGLPVNGTVVPRPVEIGVADQSWVVVKGDLVPGSWVIVVGNERLRPGQPVSIIELAPGLEAAAQTAGAEDGAGSAETRSERVR